MKNKIWVYEMWNMWSILFASVSCGVGVWYLLSVAYEWYWAALALAAINSGGMALYMMRSEERRQQLEYLEMKE